MTKKNKKLFFLAAAIGVGYLCLKNCNKTASGQRVIIDPDHEMRTGMGDSSFIIYGDRQYEGRWPNGVVQTRRVEMLNPNCITIPPDVDL